MLDSAEYDAANVFRKNAKIQEISENLRNAIRYLCGFNPHVFCDDILDKTTPIINVRCPILINVRSAAFVFRRLVNEYYDGTEILINSISYHNSIIIFNCCANTGKGYYFLDKGKHDVIFEVKFHSYEILFEEDELKSYTLPQTHEKSLGLTEFLRKHSYEYINSSNMTTLSEIILRELDISFLPEIVWPNIIGGLHGIEIKTIGAIYDFINGEPQCLFKKYTSPHGPIPTSPSSIFLFSIAVNNPESSCWKSIFPRSNCRPIFMSKDFSVGLMQKHGETKFQTFAEDNNFRIVN